MAAGGSKPAPGGACWPRVPVCIVPSGICFIFGDLGHFRSRHFVLLLFIYYLFCFCCQYIIIIGIFIVIIVIVIVIFIMITIIIIAIIVCY